jgi:uncharacterized membrane protein (UPF0136 family)
MSQVVLWIYIVLLVVGGVLGYMLARSRVSIISASVFALALVLCAEHVIPFGVSTWLLVALLVVFGVRLASTRRFMPSGLMLVFTGVTLGLIRFL